MASALQIACGMRGLSWVRAAVLGGTALFPAAAHGQDAGTPSLGAADFTLTLVRGDGHALTSGELATYFSRARCACPTSVSAELAIASDAAAGLGAHAVDAQLMIGNDCDNVDATGCAAIGAAVTLSAARPATTTSVTTAAVFAAAGRSDCNATATSTRLWAIVRLDGARLSTQPSLLLTLGGAGPAAPKDVKVVSADQGLLVSWTAGGDATALQGHQVLCAPAAASPAEPRYDTCGIPSAPDGGAGPFDSLDAQFVCSELVGGGSGSVRVHGLENGRTYQLAVVAVGVDGTPSPPSAAAEGTPAPTVGFGDLYKESGGTATGCAAGGVRPGRGAAFAAVAIGLALVRVSRRRRRAAGPLIALLAVIDAGAGAAPAWAIGDERSPLVAPLVSPRRWNVELRFGPYRPNVDSEFADRGQSGRPYEQLFSTSRHLMTQLEIDRHLSHRAGTWAAGVGIGYYNVTAAALSADLQSRTGDQTGLRLIPLSAMLVYRADTLRQRFGSPAVPYAKVGLDCTLWRISDTSQSDINGRTFGWHAAAGITLDLSPLDPEAAGSMDRESGVNQTALFIEVTRYSLDGFGSGSALRVGDTTWFAGLMLEL
jgi:hypothetical protein